MLVSVAIDLALDRLFTYTVPVELAGKLKTGQLLRVPFSGRIARGFSMRLSEGDSIPGSKFKLKPVMAIEDESPFFTPALLDLVKWAAKYYAAPLEQVLRAAVPAAVLKPNARPKELLFVSPVEGADASALTARQRGLLADLVRVGGGWLSQLCREFSTTPATLKALAANGCVEIAQKVARRDPLGGRTLMRSRPKALDGEQAAALAAIASDDPKPVLLHGVTGSGKTEVYLQAIARELEAGRGAIVLVPEISLTPQTVQRFASRFGPLVAVLHSALSDGERYDEWHRIRRGDARVVVGPRSAVFAPVRDLGLIVVDEEHDSSYKQEESPRYNARDIAVVRAGLEGAKAVLGSATPSLESWLNAKRGKYVLASMPHRVMNHPMPEVRIVDMEEEKVRSGRAPIFSAPLMDAIHSRLDRGEQTILFLNRRGYSSSLACPECGYVEECPDCSVAYTYHRVDDCLRCHICGGWKRPPQKCPECGTPSFRYRGIGTQRAEEALSKCFPKARIQRMDADSVARRHSHDEILSRFRANEIDILIGTQMIAKGLDFPNVTLVGVLNADSSLNLPDPRASERTYQLLAQVSGRAGRAELPGEVYLQTFSPDASAVQAAASDAGYIPFAETELAEREAARLPPYWRLATLNFKSKDAAQAAAWCELYAKSLQLYAAKLPASAQLLVGDPVPAALEKAEGWFRYQIVLRSKASRAIADAFRWISTQRPPPNTVRLALDIDALNLL